MLKQMREVGKSLHWVLWMVIAAFIILIFVGWGMGGMSQSGPTELWAARVGDEVITAPEFYNAFERREQSLKDLLGPQYDRRTFMNPDAVLADLIDQRILRLEAQRMGLRISPPELADAIREVPQFQDEKGEFDPKLYDDALSRARLSPVEFQESVANSLLGQKMEALVQSAVSVPESALREAWLDENQTATVDHVVFPLADYLDQVTVGDAEVKAHFDAHASDFDGGPARQVRWASFDREAYQKPLEREEEMRAYYQENLATHYTIGSDQRRARHVLVAVEPLADEAARAAARAEAEEVFAKAVAGADFAELARRHSDDAATVPAGGDLGPFYQGLLDPAVDDAAFTMEVGEVRGPIETPAGFEVIQVTKAAGEVARPFDEVRDLVARGLYAAKASEAAQAALETFQEAYSKKPDFEAAAKAAGVTPSEPRWVTSGEIVPELGPNPAVTARAFTVDVGGVTEPLAASGGQAVLEVLAKRDASPRTLDEVREQVESAVRQEAARKLARADAEAALASVRSGVELAQAVAPRPVQQSQGLRRGQPVGDLGPAPALSAAIFATPAGDVGPIADSDVGPVIFRVTERVEFDQAAFDAAKPTLRQRLEGQAYVDFRKANLDRLRESYEGSIQTNEQVLAHLRGSAG